MRPIRVKVCGIKSARMLECAAQAGADTIGIVFYPPSVRAVKPERARGILADRPPGLRIAGLFVNETRRRVLEIATELKLDFIQLHGDESVADADFFRERGFGVVKALRIGSAADAEKAAAYEGVQILFDVRIEGVPGGTGRSFDWHLLDSVPKLEYPFVIAGGIGAHNVAAAVRASGAGAVDASSALERRPGVKDPKKIGEFVQAALAVLKGLPDEQRSFAE